LVFRPQRKRSCLRASLSAWYPAYWHKWLKTCAYCRTVRVPWVKFIEISLNESFGDVVRSKSGPKLVPSDDMTGRLHGLIMIPPDAGSATELLGCKERFVLI
jgi:hypothetical protein